MSKPILPALSRLNHLVSEMYGAGAQIKDTPNAGKVGQIDPGDHLEIVGGPAASSSVLGVAKAEDIVFRQRVVDAAYALAESGASFAGSSKGDKVNKKLWTMGYGGKMQVRKFLPENKLGKPSDAINDIFDNGQLYGFECATAMMVIYHKAILDHIGAEAFDHHFTEPKNLTFFRWSIEDDDFTAVKKIVEDPKISSQPPVPGSHYYFKNPDASDENSAFRGENTIYLGDDKWYAHGVVGSEGTYIVTTAEVKSTLSALRKPGSQTEPFRIPMEMHLDGLAVSKLAVPEMPTA